MVLLFFVYIIYINFIVDRECTCTTELKLSDENINHKFNSTDHSLFIFDTLENCASSCLRVTRCVFVNYDFPAKTCLHWYASQRFFIGKTRSTTMALVDMNDWKRVLSRDPCSNKPCLGHQRCIPNGSSYICELYCPCCNAPLLFWRSNAANVSSIDRTSRLYDLGLISTGGWVPKPGDQRPHVVFTFRENPFIVKGIITRGDEWRQGWVTSYTVETSMDCSTFIVLDTFDANEDAANAKITYIIPPIVPKCMKIIIEAYEKVRSMRMDLFGCFV